MHVSPNYYHEYNLNGVVLTVHRLAGSTKIWYLASVVYVHHADVVLADIQMCSV